MPDVRSKSGTPVASDFASGKGTPIVVDQSNGQCYVMTDDNAMCNITLGVFNAKAFGAIGDGTTDDTAAIQAAIDACTTGGIVFVPQGIYLITTPINLVNLEDKHITIQGAGRGDGLYNTTPSYGTNFYGRTGTQAVFETQGSHFVTFKDLQIYSMVADTDRSAIGVFIGRTTVEDFAQFHHYQRVNIILGTKPTANSNRGSIAILNVGGEHGEFHHLFLIADTPIVNAIVNPFSYSPTYGTLGSNESSTVNNYYGCVFNSISNWAMELWACMSCNFLGCYYGTITGDTNLTTAVILRESQGVAPRNLYFVGGQIEHWDNFMQCDDGTSDITIDLTYAGPTAAGPAVYINQAVNGTFHGFRVRFANPWGIEMSIISPGVATGVVLYGGELTLSNGIDLDESTLEIQGTTIRDSDITPNAVTVDAASTYLLANSSGVSIV